MRQLQLPAPSQTPGVLSSFVHGSPAGEKPVSTHAAGVALQSTVPVWHVAGAHAAPAAQAQVPAVQTRYVPHEVPSGTVAPVSSQVCAPVAQEVAPTWQRFAGVHAWFAVHETHWPVASHTRFVPQLLPIATRVPWSTQVDAPVEHEVRPAWHGSAGVHAWFAVQETHAPPASHTRFVPQLVPGFTRAPVSVQTWSPVAQEVVPTWQASAGVHAAFEMHATHAPVGSQTWFAPHDVPGGASTLVSTHVRAPVEQEVVPTSHGFAGVHDWPAVHETHWPVGSQTTFVPHEVPGAASVFVSTHVCAPVEHEVRPTWHGSAGVQSWFAVQATHAPVGSHTWFVPHDVPAGASAFVSTQV
jgi:hypothetical protein